MDWSKVAEIVITILVYGVTFQVVLWVLGYELKPKLKYKFDCPFCEFKVSANSRDIVTQVQVTHQHYEIRDK